MKRNHKEWESYAGRLLWAMRRAGKTNQSELARAVGVKPQSIQYLCDPQSGARGSSHTPSLARVLGVQADWLATGQGTPDVAPLPRTAEPAVAYVLPQLGVQGAFRALPQGGVIELAGGVDSGLSGGRVTVPVVSGQGRALRVSGEGLAPYARDGQFLLLQALQAGATEVEPDDTLLITLQDGQAIVRELIANRGDHLVVQPIMGGVPEVIPHTDVLAIEAIMGVASRRWWQAAA